MLSNSSKYAIKAVLYLAVHASQNHKVLAKDMSGPTNIPKAYLSKILQELTRHKIVSSMRGPGGGFYLSDDNKETPLLQIVRVIDGDTDWRSGNDAFKPFFAIAQRIFRSLLFGNIAGNLNKTDNFT